MSPSKRMSLLSRTPGGRGRTAPNAGKPGEGAQKMGASCDAKKYYSLKRQGTFTERLMVGAAVRVVENMRMHQKNEITEWLTQKGAQLHRHSDKKLGVFFILAPDKP